MSGRFGSWEEAVLWLRSQKDQQDLVQACFYDDPLIEASERYYRSTEWQAIQRLLCGIHKGDALDIGAGRGISSYALARDGWQVTALEPDDSDVVGSGAIRRLSVESSLDISVYESTGENLPFADRRFDLVFARQVLHHARDLLRFCREIHRVLRPTGRFLVIREHVVDRPEDLSVFLSQHPIQALYGGEHAFSLGTYLGAFGAANLSLTNIYKPYDTDINLFPATSEGIRHDLARRLGFRLPMSVFRGFIVPLLNRVQRTPGRLYSFWGRKA